MGDPVTSTLAMAGGGGPLGKPQAPQAPNYQGAAYAQAGPAAHQNQMTPYGNMTWTQSDAAHPAQSQWTSHVDLNPQAQSALNSQLGLSNQMGNIATNQASQVQDTYSHPMDLSSVPQIADQAYGAMTSRLDPQWQQSESMRRTALANQGLVPGGEAYNNAMREFGQGRNDAYQQARLAAIQTMPQTYQLASSTYNQPLNTLNALRTGAQIENPQFQAPIAGPNLLGAAQGQGAWDANLYNTQVGSWNNMMSGLFDIGSSAAMPRR